MLNQRQTGVSLIEVVIGLVILGLLMAMGVPEYSKFLANARLRATAEALAGTLNLARAEAVKRNARVEFVMTNEEPIAAVVNDSGLASASGINWIVREFVPSTGSYNFIEGKFAAEGSGRADSTPIQITPVTAGVFGGSLTFTGFGALSTGQSIQFQITNTAAGACDTTAVRGPMRCLNINVSPGGQIRICDPKVTDAKDTRTC